MDPSIRKEALKVKSGLEEGLPTDFSAKDQIGEVIPWTSRDGKKYHCLSLGTPCFLRLAKIVPRRDFRQSLSKELRVDLLGDRSISSRATISRVPKQNFSGEKRPGKVLSDLPWPIYFFATMKING